MLALQIRESISDSSVLPMQRNEEVMASATNTVSGPKKLPDLEPQPILLGMWRDNNSDYTLINHIILLSRGTST